MGAHGGFRWVDADFSSASYTAPLNAFLPIFPARNENYDLDSPIAGVHLGYSKKSDTSNWLWGIEGGFSWAWGDDTVSTTGAVDQVGPTVGSLHNFTQVSEVESDWQATLRARLGWVDGPWLYFATLGVAWMDVEWRDTISATGGVVPATVTFNHSKDFTVVGLVVGGGVEKQLNNPLWRARLEYFYEHFDDSELVPHGATNPAQTGTLDIDDVHKIRFAISRKIGN